LKVNPDDRPKIAILIGAIVLIGGYGVFSLISRKAPEPTVPGQVADPGSNLPTAQMLAEGKLSADPSKPKTEDLMAVFPSSEMSAVAMVNPFRSPVPKAKVGNEVAAPPPVQQTSPPAVPNREINTSGGFAPVNVGESGQTPGPTIQSVEPMLVKGIISAEEGMSNGMAFIKVGDRSKGYRVGSEVLPGVRVLSITNYEVTVGIGKARITARVGQEIKP
jgi:hypothetical protein